MDDTEEENLVALRNKTNRLVCKDDSFPFMASPIAKARAENLTLVGQIVVDHVINKNKVAIITQKAWSPAKGMSVKVVAENLFLFSFNDAIDKCRIKGQAPWNIDGYHLILKRVEKNQLPCEVDFSITSFWVKPIICPWSICQKKMPKLLAMGWGSSLMWIL